MPYKQITQLPDSVKNNLPKQAQEIYRAFLHSTRIDDPWGSQGRA